MQPRQVSNVSSASEAARNTLERLKEQGKLGLAKAIAKGGKHLGTLPPEQIVERVPAVVGLATAHAKLYPEQQAGPVVAIQLLASPVEHEKAANATAVEHAPVLDLGE